MARSQPRRQPEKPGGEMRHHGHLAVLAFFLLLAAQPTAQPETTGEAQGHHRPAAERPSSPTPRLGGGGTAKVEFGSVSAGVRHTCGVRTDGTVECWGHDGSGRATPLPGEFASVSAGGFHTRGVRPGGSVECWGSNEDLFGNKVGQATPPSGEFASASAGEFHTCRVRRDGSVQEVRFSRAIDLDATGGSKLLGRVVP